MSPRPKNAIIKDDEWRRIQPIIRRLYLLEDRSLKDVIVILSTIHNFCASKAQLERKLKQWHMAKIMTSLEWKHVDTRIRRRRLQGKESKVFLSGIPLRPATVEKARSRHSFESTLDRIAGKAPPSPEDLSLIIRTPSPPAEVRLCNTYNIPWLLAKDFFRGLNLGSFLDFHRSTISLRPPIEKLLSLTFDNRSELSNHTSKLQYTVQALTLIMPETTLENHVFFAESLHLSPMSSFNDSESFEVLLFLLSNNFLSNAFTIEGRKEEAVVVGLLLSMVKRSRVLDSLATQPLTSLPLSLQSALHRLFKEAVRRSELDLIRLLLQIGVDVDQPLAGIFRDYGIEGAFTAFEYAALAYDQDLIRFLIDSEADTRIEDTALILLAWSRRKTHASASEGAIATILSSFIPFHEVEDPEDWTLWEIFYAIASEKACPVSEQIIGFFWAQIRHSELIPAFLIAAIKSQSRFAFDLLSDKKQFINISVYTGQTPLTAAVCMGSSHLVEHLLQLGANIAPLTQTYGSEPIASPLQCAAFYADDNMVRLLLREGADINFCHSSDALYLAAISPYYVKDRDKTHILGKTALQAAILGSNTEVALFLLAAGARLVGGELALAIRSRQQIVADALLARGTSLKDNSATLECGSVLEAAVVAEDVDLITRIIQSDAKAVDEAALWAAIFVAKCSSDLAIIRLLIAHYVRAGVSNDLWLGTAMNLAAQLGLHEISEAMLTSGLHPATCKCEWVRPWDGDDPLTKMPEYYFKWRRRLLEDRDKTSLSLMHGAIRIGQPEYLKSMLRLGYQSPFYCTPPFYGHKPSLETLQILHEHGTKMTAQNLTFSIQQGLRPVTRWLLSLNINLNETILDDEQKSIAYPWTPMHAAAERGDIALFERLRILGADINAPPSTNHGGVTALQAASIKGYFGLVTRLLELGADPNARGSEILGRTALEGAAEHGRLDVVQLLLNSGVETYGSGRRQYVRAIELAREEGHYTVVTLLKSHRPWTEADQEILNDNTLLWYDQTPEGLAKRLGELNRRSVQMEDTVSEASETNKGRQLVMTGSELREVDPGEEFIAPLPSSTLEEIRETLRDNTEIPSLPGDTIWAEAYENWSLESPWLLE